MKMDALRLVGHASVDFPRIGTDRWSGPYQLKGVVGLDPPDIAVQMAKSTLLNATYRGKTPTLRQVVMVVNLRPRHYAGQTADELRSALYPYLTPKYDELLRLEILHEGEVQAVTYGQVSKFEAALFSNEPAVQITFDCDRAYFEHPHVLFDSPRIRNWINSPTGVLKTFDAHNLGTAPTGFKMGITFEGDFSGSIGILPEDTRGARMTLSGIDWKRNDRLIMDTRSGSQGIWRVARGTTAEVSILTNMTSDSDWIQLHHGLNSLLVFGPSFYWDQTYNFTYRPTYWGV